MPLIKEKINYFYTIYIGVFVQNLEATQNKHISSKSILLNILYHSLYSMSEIRTVLWFAFILFYTKLKYLQLVGNLKWSNVFGFLIVSTCGVFWDTNYRREVDCLPGPLLRKSYGIMAKIELQIFVHDMEEDQVYAQCRCVLLTDE